MADKAVLDFFAAQNRPYSLADIQAGVKGDIPKATLQKAVTALVEQGLIREKVYSKQKVYFPAQTSSQSPKDLAEEMRALDRQINDVTAKFQEAEGALKTIRAKYTERQGRMTIAEACAKKVEFDMELRVLKDELKAFDGVHLIEPKVKEQVQKEYDRHLMTYRKRKRMCLDMLDAILESYPGKKAKLYEEIGIETDEEAGFSVTSV